MTAMVEEAPHQEDSGPENDAGLEKITELAEFEPTRVDAVDFPATGLPILMLKALGGNDHGPARARAGTMTEEAPPMTATVTEAPPPAAPEASPPVARDAPPVPQAPPDGPQDAVKAAAPAAPAEDPDTVMVPLPRGASVSISPADLAKLATLRRELTLKEAAVKADDGKAKGTPVGLTDAIKRKFTADLADTGKNPTAHVSQWLRRCNQWAAKGSYPTGLSYSDVRWMASQCVKELKKRSPDSEASMDGFPAAKSAGPASPGTAEKCQAGQDALTAAASDSQGHDTRKATAGHAAKARKPKGGKKPFPGAAPPFRARGGKGKPAGDGDGKDGSGDAGGDGGKAAKAGRACKCGSMMAKGARFCSECGAPAKAARAEKAGKPFPADQKVDEAIDDLKDDAQAALDAQARDPDAASHPADRKVTAELDRVKADVEAAAEAQADDERTDTAEGHHAKSAAEPPVYHLHRLHDATCAAYHLDDVTAAHPLAAKGLGELIDPSSVAAMVTAALAQDGGTGSRATDLPGLSDAYGHAVALKALAAQPGLLDEAMDGLRKAFAEYFPDAHPKPGSITPGEFHRPYLSAGHATQSARPGQHPRVPLASHVPEASDFRRPLVTAGREAASPGSKPSGVGKAARTYYTNAGKEQAASTLAAMHDWIADNHPSVCPMRGTTYDGEPAQPGSMGSTLTTARPAPARLAATKDKSAPVPVTAGQASAVVTPGPARKRKLTKEERKMAKAAKRAGEAAAAAVPQPPAIDMDLLKSVLSEVVAEQVGGITKTIGGLDERLAGLESSPDPGQMAPRSGAAALAKARQEAGPEVPAGGDGPATERLMRLMKRTMDPDGGVRVAAIGELTELVGRERAAELLSAAP